MTRLGPTRLRILALIIAGKEARIPPTFQELADACDMHVNAVSGHLDALEREGLIARVGFKARTIRPLCRFIPAEAR